MRSQDSPTYFLFLDGAWEPVAGDHDRSIISIGAVLLDSSGRGLHFFGLRLPEAITERWTGNKRRNLVLQCSTSVDNVLSRQYVQEVLQCATRGFGPCRPLCGLPLCSLCLPHLCSGRVPYVLVSDCDVFRKISCLSLNVIQFHVLTFMRCVDVTLLGKCFQFKPQPKQPN